MQINSDREKPRSFALRLFTASYLRRYASIKTSNDSRIEYEKPSNFLYGTK